MRTGVVLAAGFAVQSAAAQDAAVSLPGIVVSSVGLDWEEAFVLPASVSVVDLDEFGVPPGNLGGVTVGVPGLLARERQNQAQDTQLSIRGFGSRATFGVRGLRLYVDGIPATMPDGQGQIAHFPLFAGDRIEVLRGPFSALYGNSSGGVVHWFTSDGAASLRGRMQALAGSYGSRGYAASLSGGGSDFGYHAAISRSDSDGFREHSAARREVATFTLRKLLGEAGRLALHVNRFDSPFAQDPLGLTRAEAQASPRAATSVARAYATRKSVRQDQLGVVYDHAISPQSSLRAMAYAGHREIEQFLGVPRAAQNAPTSAGGVVDLDASYAGGDLRWSWHRGGAGQPFGLSAGVAFDTLRQQRRGFENFLGDTLGVRGALRRDERNTARNFDPYLQATWNMAERWSLLAGVRHSRVRYLSRDQYVTGLNPDDSGSADYTQTTPVAGLSFAPRADTRFYLSFGRGFETPTLNELGYRADGAAGLAFDLLPARSRHGELGFKWRAGAARVEAAVFRADTRDELAVARNLGGRSSFRNVGRARREGLELATSLPLGASWRWQLAYTRLAARFRDTFPICATAGCASPNQAVAAGTRIPGTVRDQFASRLDWYRGEWNAALQLVAVGDVKVNDSGSQRAPGYAISQLEFGRRWTSRAGAGLAFARIDNLFDRRYIGSVIVNEGNARYYEPGPDRTLSVGVRWDWGSGD
ncbi:MAG: TonB-dependent receptor [Rhodanobacteraceae bacterium]|nr:TonB-dependent receptor [Rhodanobacteraceae bacterium]